jgi:hypothetical protein
LIGTENGLKLKTGFISLINEPPGVIIVLVGDYT